ncbi:TetR/AcrR family transcriptional regulator [Amycolatopsis minnesotensis]|uniref:TetR/AcrR family transcriptional regulator n=1 Tax=Amycolatopsis minnesotensis TaxID=337894 RepID=A0ABN2QBE8_9PSEU
MSPRGRPRGFDREVALREAMHVFWERGYEGASLADLTAAMGINSPSMYAAFGGKEALFREALALYGRTSGSQTDRALAAATTTRDAVEAMLRDNARVYVEPGHPRGCMVVHAVTNYAPGNQVLHDDLAKLRRGAVCALRDRIRQGVAAGELPADLDAEGLASFYVAVLNGLSTLARDGAGGAELDAVVERAMKAWNTLSGMKDDEGAAPR